MKICKGRIPRRFTHRLTKKFHETLEELDSVTEDLIKYGKEFIVVERKKGFAVFTTGNDIMTKEEEEDCKARQWVKRKMREGDK